MLHVLLLGAIDFEQYRRWKAKMDDLDDHSEAATQISNVTMMLVNNDYDWCSYAFRRDVATQLSNLSNFVLDIA